MIRIHNVWKAIEKGRARIPVFQNLSAVLPTDRRLAILGLPGSGKSTLIELLSGVQRPDKGTIFRDATVSIPVGDSMGMIQKQSLRRNCIFAARLYQVDPSELIRFVATIGDIGKYMDTPLRDVSPTVSRAFRFGLAYGLPYETYLVDGHPLPRGAELRKKFVPVLQQRAKTSGFIVCTTNVRFARSFCDVGAILHEGTLRLFPDFERALSTFSILMARSSNESGLEASELTLLKAKRALKSGNFALVEDIAEAESDQNEENPVALWLLGEVALARGDRQEGVALITQACESGALEEAWMALSRLAADEPDPEKRRAMALMMLEHESGSVRQSGAKLIESFADVAESLSAWRNVLRISPDDPSILLDAAKMEVEAGHLREALDIVNTAHEIDPASWRVLLAKAKIEQAIGQFVDMSNTVVSLARIRPTAGRRFVKTLVNAGLHDVAGQVREITEGEQRRKRRFRAICLYDFNLLPDAFIAKVVD